MYSSRAVMFKHGASFGPQDNVRPNQRSTALTPVAWIPWCSTWGARGAWEHTYTQEDINTIQIVPDPANLVIAKF